jgi:hypothetical protein
MQNTKNPPAGHWPQDVDALRAALEHARKHRARCEAGAREALDKWTTAEATWQTRGRNEHGGRVVALEVEHLWRVYQGEQDGHDHAVQVVAHVAALLERAELRERLTDELSRAAATRDQLAADALKRLTEAEERDRRAATSATGEESREVQIRRREYHEARNASRAAFAKLRAVTEPATAAPAAGEGGHGDGHDMPPGPLTAADIDRASGEVNKERHEREQLRGALSDCVATLACLRDRIERQNFTAGDALHMIASSLHNARSVLAGDDEDAERGPISDDERSDGPRRS